MRRSVLSIARSAKSLLQAADSGCTATSPAQQQCAAASAHRAFAAAAAPGATPAPGSPTAEAQAAITSSSQRTSRGSSSSSTPGGGGGSLPPNGGPDPSSSGGGGGLFFPVLTLAAAGGGYYAYTQKNNGTEGGGHKLPQGVSREQLDATQKAALDLLQKSKQKVQELLPAAVGGTSKKTAPDAAKTPSSSSSSSLVQQKQRDQDDAGFKMLPPGREDASAAAAAADAAASASAAARDSLSAAADEFPGSTEGAAATQQGPAVVLEDLGGLMDMQQVDLTPITDLFADVTGVKPSATSSSSGSSGSKASAPAPATDAAAYLVTGVTAMQASPATAATPATPAAAPAQSPGPTVALKEVEDSELEKLCQKLGLSRDLAPSGLVAAANRAGLGSVNSSGAHLPPQMAQLNQATADARILGEVLELSAQNTAKLVQELQEARRHAAWTEEAAEKRETSLTEHFKELMREQSRIHQQLTEAAVKEAEQLVIADTAKAHLQERQERLQQIDALRDKVNALALAFDLRTAQLRSVQDVNRVSVGMLSLSKALEEGTPVGPHLQQLVSSCPDDPLIEAVAASLPASAASQGLPTLQELRERFTDVAQAAAEASYFSGQDAHGGVLAHLAAKLAARLKVDAGPDVANGVDGKLSQARALLQTGQLCAAAEALMEAADGTQAAAAVQQWVVDARTRAAADQAVKLLQAHATATAGLTS